MARDYTSVPSMLARSGGGGEATREAGPKWEKTGGRPCLCPSETTCRWDVFVPDRESCSLCAS